MFATAGSNSNLHVIMTDMMTSFDYKYQNALRHIVIGISSFVKNHSRVTQICITKIRAKCILVVVVKIMKSSYKLRSLYQFIGLSIRFPDFFSDFQRSVMSFLSLVDL